MQKENNKISGVVVDEADKITQKTPQEEMQTFSDAEIKKRLKKNGKGALITIIQNLAEKVDEHKAHKKEINKKVHDIDMNAGFKNVQDIAELLNLINKEV